MTLTLNPPGAPGAASANRPLRLVLLDALAAHGAFMTSAELADAVGLWPDAPRINRQSRVNAALRAMQARGQVDVAGVRRVYNNIPSHLWGITQRGIDELGKPWPPPPTRTFLYRRELAERKAAKAESAVLIAAYVDDMKWRLELDAATPVPLRRAAILDLRRHGATLAQCAQVFGISREQVRVDQIKAELDAQS